MSDEVLDTNGTLIQVGSKVLPDGEVLAIGDWDGDMRDGRMVGLPPRVTVKWVEFDEPEIFTSGMRPDERTYCDDLEVIV